MKATAQLPKGRIPMESGLSVGALRYDTDMPAAPAHQAHRLANARRDGLLLFVLGALIFVLLGLALERAAAAPGEDFRALYYPAKTLLAGADPYNAGDLLNVLRADGPKFGNDAWKLEQIATRSIYPPTAYTFVLPFALLPWRLAQPAWLALTILSLVGACVLVWRVCAQSAPLLAGSLLALLLINSELIVIANNSAGIVVSLCVVAVYCFLYQRYPWLGVLCLAASVSIKPHETGLVWIYFLLAGGVYRKRAVQTLLVAVLLALPCLAWVFARAPHWLGEWQSNIAFLAAPGGISDPGPHSLGGHGLAMVISLQALLSYFWDDPRFYNLGSYVLTAPLLLVWILVTVHTRATRERAWLAIASITLISLLPVYHRQYDARMLLLTIPGCVVLCTQLPHFGGMTKLVTAGAILFTGDLLWAILLALLSMAPQPATPRAQWFHAAVEMLPAPLVLLLAAIFFLWAYWRFAAVQDADAQLPA
ncbi:MAG TPA: glycosyltransferase family 87 protein [Terracidiphilus sp.]